MNAVQTGLHDVVSREWMIDDCVNVRRIESQWKRLLNNAAPSL